MCFRRLAFLALFFGCSSFSFAIQQNEKTVVKQTQNQDAIAGLGNNGADAKERLVPRVLRFSGRLENLNASAAPRIMGITFGLFTSADSQTPLWLETQSVNVDENGRYTVLLGSKSSEGLPAYLFANGEARWLGVILPDLQSLEQPRVLLVSVPYALKAIDAETLGGRPASAYALVTAGVNLDSRSGRVRNADSSAAQSEITGTGDTGTVNHLGKFSGTGADVPIVDSIVVENGGKIGVGTANPFSLLANTSLNFFNTVGTGAAANSLSWGLNSLGYVAVFGNSSAASGGSNGILVQSAATDGNSDIARFESGGSVKMSVRADGNVGIGTANPTQKLEVNGNLSTGTTGTLFTNAINSNSGTFFINYSGGGGDTYFGRNGQLFISANGNVGIGTSSPSQKLEVNGSLSTGVSGTLFTNAINSNSGAFFINFSGGSGDTFFGRNGALYISKNGNIGINNFSPVSVLDVPGTNSASIILGTQKTTGANTFSIGSPPPSAIHGDTTTASGFISGVFGTTSSTDGFGVLGENLASGQGTGHSAGVRGITANTSALGTGVWGDALQTSGDNVGVFGHSSSDTGTGVQGLADSATGDAVGVYGRSNSTTGAGVWGEATAGTSVTIGTAVLAGVYGKIAANGGAAGLFDSASSGDILIGRSGSNATKVFRVDSTGKGFFNAGTQTGGADFAESVAVLDNKSEYDAGEVIAIDTTGVRRFTKVSKPYSTLVAGIYSTKPGVLATPHWVDDPRTETEEIPLAMVGIVPCKVTSENGIINAGDLLVSSSTSGFAMKGTDRARMTGAIIGKALQSMHGKTGVIEILVSLQ